jgi:PncC family amidohydrolase
VYRGGVVCYANELKTSLLGVPPATLDTYGAVSEPVALAMAEGAVARLGVDVAVSVTGIAGPGGGSADKPVGTVWIGIAGADGPSARRTVLGGGRHEVRARAAQAALYLVLRRLRATAGEPLPL